MALQRFLGWAMMDYEDGTSNLTGTFLFSHPVLLDPNFRRSVVLISSHSREEGAFGVIVNRPKEVRLGELDSAFLIGTLAEVPVFEGGPVRSDEIILAGWQWLPETGNMKLFFGIEPDLARSLAADEQFTLRAFLGYAGWGEGQLEEEMGMNSWIVAPLERSLLESTDGSGMWRNAIRKLGPDMRLMAELPDDPGAN